MSNTLLKNKTITQEVLNGLGEFIWPYQFYKFSLETGTTNLTLPAGLKYILDYGISNISGLTGTLTCNSELKVLQSVNEGPLSLSLNNGLEYIGMNVLDSVRGECSIPDSVVYMETEAARNNTRLTSIRLSNSLTTLYNFTFSGCTALTTVTNTNSIKDLKVSVFEGCTGLTSIEFLNCIVIGGSAFKNCNHLTTVNFPEVRAIGTDAFSGCTGLTSLSFPKAITLNQNCFWNCSNITSVSLPKVKTVYARVFYNCTGLTNVELPKATSVLQYAFANCTNITSLSLPSIISLPANALNTMSGLTTLTLGPDCTMTATSFTGCTSLATINIMGDSTCLTATKLAALSPSAYNNATIVYNYTSPTD